jgi:hypothetical protein
MFSSVTVMSFRYFFATAFLLLGEALTAESALANPCHQTNLLSPRPLAIECPLVLAQQAPNENEKGEFEESLLHEVERTYIDPGAALLLAEQVAKGKMSLKEGMDWIGRLHKMREEQDALDTKRRGPCPTFKAYLEGEVKAGRLTQYAADTLYQFRGYLPGKSPEMARALAPCGL